MGRTTLDKQVISKKRVADHGEVLTAEREVNAMLHLVRHETERIDSRFLEPACGTGNFLVPILEKKLNSIKAKYSKSQLEFERYSVVATGSIYGVEILADNVRECQERLFSVFNDLYTALYKKHSKDSCRDAIRFILRRNILHGDALSLKTVSEEKTPIIFSEWTLVGGSKIKRRDFTFAELIPGNKENEGLFVDTQVSDTGSPVFIPKSVKDYPLTHFLTLAYETTN